MSLPQGFNIEKPDNGIRELVINLNQIPGVDTDTTCEGHVWYEFPKWPTKDGWIHFSTSKGENKDLVELVKSFCSKSGYFKLEGPKELGEISSFTIIALYEPHHDEKCENLFAKWSRQQQQDYFRRAEDRRKQHAQGWKELNELVIDYIKEKALLD
jgi:hypothetical protein